MSLPLQPNRFQEQDFKLFVWKVKAKGTGKELQIISVPNSKISFIIYSDLMKKRDLEQKDGNRLKIMHSSLDLIGKL